LQQINVGIAGAGYTGRLHLAGYRSLGPGVVVRGIADTDQSKAAGLDLGNAKFYAELDALLVDPHLDAVSICLPTAGHHSATITALQNGKHVLVEKPAACTEEQFDEMLRLAQERQRLLMVGMTHRFYPELRIAQDLLRSGAIGSPIFCRDSVVEFLGMLNLPSWYLDPMQACAGVVMTSGIHLVDRLLWLTGGSVSECSGYRRNLFLNSAVEDEAMMQLKLSNGVAAHIALAWLPFPHPVVCDLDIYGTQGSIHVHTWQGVELIGAEGKKSWECYSPGADHVQKVQVGINAEVAEFVDSIQKGRQPVSSAEETGPAFRVVCQFLRQTPLLPPNVRDS
jgi:predicted dehydrogenase